MFLFLDTEFTGFHQPELISIGLVSECGRHEFYAERNDFDLAKCNDFVRSTVLPKLEKAEAMDQAKLTDTLLAWLDRLRALDAGEMVLVLYDFNTDFELLAHALGGVLPVWLEGTNVANEVNSITWARDDLEGAANAHHALHDARELRVDWLATRAGEKR